MSENENERLVQLLAEHDIALSIDHDYNHAVPKSFNEGRHGHQSYLVKVRNKASGAKFQYHFYSNPSAVGEPTAADVLSVLRNEVLRNEVLPILDNDFASAKEMRREYGMEEGSGFQAARMFNAMERTANGAKRTLGRPLVDGIVTVLESD